MRKGPHSQLAVLTGPQLRAARALLDWSRAVLAEKSGTSAVSIEQFERGVTDPKLRTAGKWRRTLEKAGVVFIDQDNELGPGVRLRKRQEEP
jgi:transcriptional regulator with XRE-family HTH domain